MTEWKTNGKDLLQFILYSKEIYPFFRSTGSREGMKASRKHRCPFEGACSVSSPHRPISLFFTSVHPVIRCWSLTCLLNTCLTLNSAGHSWLGLSSLGMDIPERANPSIPVVTQSTGTHWYLVPCRHQQISNLGGLALLFLTPGFFISHGNCQQVRRQSVLEITSTIFTVQVPREASSSWGHFSTKPRQKDPHRLPPSISV